jgi:hypothetical protein
LKKYYPNGWRFFQKPARLGLGTCVKNMEIALPLNKTSANHLTLMMGKIIKRKFTPSITSHFHLIRK